MPKFKWAPYAFSKLNGIFCVYKPVGVPCHRVKDIVTHNLIKDLNALPCHHYEWQMQKEQGVYFNVKQPVPTNVPDHLTDLSDHRLVLGERYISDDIQLKFLHGLDVNSSGVLVMNVGRHDDFTLVAMARYLRVYHVKGRFGFATDNCTPKGKLIERTTFHHINQGKLDKACSAAQSGHQRNMFQYAGVQPNSQEAYEMACQGIVRPLSKETPPMLYGIKCIHYEPPDFTLEIHAINERTDYLRRLVHDIGLKLKSTAVCTHIHRLRYGHFTLQHALLRQQWRLEEIVKNMSYCRTLLTPDKLFTDVNVTADDKWKSKDKEPDTTDMIKMMVKKQR